MYMYEHGIYYLSSNIKIYMEISYFLSILREQIYILEEKIKENEIKIDFLKKEYKKKFKKRYYHSFFYRLHFFIYQDLNIEELFSPKSTFDDLVKNNIISSYSYGGDLFYNIQYMKETRRDLHTLVDSLKDYKSKTIELDINFLYELKNLGQKIDEDLSC